MDEKEEKEEKRKDEGQATVPKVLEEGGKAGEQKGEPKVQEVGGKAGEPESEPVVQEERKKEGEPKGGEVTEDLFDIVVPVGTPRSVIRDVVRKFPVQLVERRMPAYFANMEGDEREVLAFRGPRKVVEEVEQFIRKELEAFIETGGWRKEKPPES